MTSNRPAPNLYAAGFDDEMPCARRRYFGIGATLFDNEADAQAFVGTSLYSVHAYHVADPATLIAQQDDKQRRHAASLGMAHLYKTPARTARPA